VQIALLRIDTCTEQSVQSALCFGLFSVIVTNKPYTHGAINYNKSDKHNSKEYNEKSNNDPLSQNQLIHL